MKFSSSFVLLAGLILSAPIQGEAACVGPMLRHNLGSGAPGTTVEISGQLFTDGCHDVVINGNRIPTLPAKNVRIMFRQGDVLQQLAVVDADKDFAFTLTVTIPASAVPGEAVFIAEHPWGKTVPLNFTITKNDPAPPRDATPGPAR